VLVIVHSRPVAKALGEMREQSEGFARLAPDKAREHCLVRWRLQPADSRSDRNIGSGYWPTLAVPF
jgi:hypothetical protein